MVVAAAAAAVDEDEGGIDLLANKSAGGGSNEEETSKDEDHSSSSLQIPADAGVLSSLSSSSSSSSSSASRVLVQSTASPTPVPPVDVCGAAGSVDCDKGFVLGDPTTSCETACAGACCVGTDACTGFTGKVCKDGSCDGIKACQDSTIPWVVNSCKGSRYACFLLGNVGNIVNSCQGTYACNAMGRDQNSIYCPFGPGTVGEIRDSCIGNHACSWMSYNGGTVGHVINSCRAKKACQYVANKGFYPHLSDQGDIVNLCNGYKCCFNADVLPAVCPTAKSGKKNKKAKPTQAPTVSAAPVKAKAAKKKTNMMIASLFN